MQSATADPKTPTVSRHSAGAMPSDTGAIRPRNGVLTRVIGKRVRRDKRSRPALVALTCLLVAALALPATVWATDTVDGTTAAELGVPASALPGVKMSAGILVTEDGRVLWSRNADTKRAMASITKIMTAVVALENSRPDEVVTVPEAARSVGESTSFLRPGANIQMADLLEALLVKSGNDAAITVAHHVANDEKGFVAMMNAKAAELGLVNTHFANSHGLDAAGHHSSAADIAVLARYAMRNAEFRRYVGTKTAEVTYPDGVRELENTNLLLGNFDGANGVKTGFTRQAGYCLAASAKRGETELYAVTLGTASEKARIAETRELLDWGFAHYREQRLASAGTLLGKSVVTDYLDRTVAASVSEDTTLTVFDLAGPIDRTVSMSMVRAPVSAGERIGVATYTQRGKVIATVPLLAVEDVEAPNILERIGIGIVRVWRRFTGGPMQAVVSLGTTAVSS